MGLVGDLRNGRMLASSIWKMVGYRDSSNGKDRTMKVQEHITRRIKWIKRLTLRKIEVGVNLGMEDELFLLVEFEALSRHWAKVPSMELEKV